MIILNGGGLPTLLRCRAQYPAGATHLGRLARPRHIGRLRETLLAGFTVGVDNDAYSNWDLGRFTTQIGHIERALYGRVLTVAERDPRRGRPRRPLPADDRLANPSASG